MIKLKDLITEGDKKDFNQFQKDLVEHMKKMKGVTNTRFDGGRMHIEKDGHEFILSQTWNPAPGTLRETIFEAHISGGPRKGDMVSKMVDGQWKQGRITKASADTVEIRWKGKGSARNSAVSTADADDLRVAPIGWRIG